MANFLNSLFGSTQPSMMYTPGQERLAGDFNKFLRRSLKTGFKQYGGDQVANLTPDQEALLGQFFQSIFPSGMKGLADIAQQDSLGRAQMLLDPARQRAIEQTQRSTRERMNLGNNLLSTGGQFAEGEAVSNVNAQFLNQLSQMLPALDQIRMGAIQAMPGFTSQGLAIGDLPRQIEQQELDASYKEFLRTDPAGGPLQALLQMFGGGGGPQVVPGTASGMGNIMGSLAALAPLWAALIGGGGAAGASSWGGLAGTTGGVPLAAGAAGLSGSKYKDRIKPTDDDLVLEKVKDLPVAEWSYKGDKTRHMGPMAEEFREAFGLGDSDDKLGFIDAIGVLMSSIKALNKKVEALEPAEA